MEISVKIIDYAIRYYLRYYPSVKKLEEKLKEKFWPNSEKWKKYGGITKEQIDYIISEKLRNIIQEPDVCRAKIKNLIEKSKNKNYIVNNLLQKKFDKHLILQILEEEFHSEEETLLSKEKIYKKILLLHQKWKSMQYCKQKFIERNLDRELIEKIILEIYNGDESSGIQKELENISKKYPKNKWCEKLLQRGFRYPQIKQILTDYE